VETHARNAVGPHRKIVAALQKRDSAGAQRYMKSHLFKALEDMSLGAGQ
jgi:DNA-binding FadR family transcriptional regulator